MATPPESWQATAAAARARRDGNPFLSVQTRLSSLNLEDEVPRKNVVSIPAPTRASKIIYLTCESPEELLSDMVSRELSAVEVTTAFLDGAEVAKDLTNCGIELLSESALARAAELDAHMANHGKTIGALHGLPISVEGCVNFKDNNPGQADSLCLQILREAGAVLHARTSQTQTVMHDETSNNPNATVTPYNRGLSARGGLGGESGLIAMGGSVLGIGSDIGGGVRGPAAACGLYGFKPTSRRLPLLGSALPPEFANHIPATIGPLSTSLEGIELFMKTMLDAKPWEKDPTLKKLPWVPYVKPSVGKTWLKEIKIGVLWNDKMVRPHPPIERALQEVISRLLFHRGQNDIEVKIVELYPHNHEEAQKIAAALYFPDGGERYKKFIEESGESWSPLLKHIIHENECCKKLSAEELKYWLNQRDKYRKEHTNYWNAMRGSDGKHIDVILCPTMPSIASVLESAKYWSYTSHWNVLDCPAIVFPVTKCNAELDTRYRRQGNDKDNCLQKSYNADQYNGAPVGLQLVGRPDEDEKLISIMSSIKDILDLPFKPPSQDRREDRPHSRDWDEELITNLTSSRRS